MGQSIKQPAKAPVARGARRKQRTRGRLLEAARTLFSRQGVDATAIAEITELADVGFGSFYNHFESKDQIAAAVVEQTLAEQGAAIAGLAEQIEDPAEVVSVAHRHITGLARTDPTWAWLLLRLELSHRAAGDALNAYARSDLERGVESGRFRVADTEVALAATGGALLGVLRALLDGGLGDDADVLHAEGVLRMLGLETQDAAAVARRPLPARLA